MKRPSEINPQKLRLMLMTSLITSQRGVKVGWLQEMDTYSAYMSKSQYMESYWFSSKSNINIIYNISVVTITITMSVILANFGKYAISDCPFILFVCLFVCLSLRSIIDKCVNGFPSKFQDRSGIEHETYWTILVQIILQLARLFHIPQTRCSRECSLLMI